MNLSKSASSPPGALVSFLVNGACLTESLGSGRGDSRSGSTQWGSGDARSSDHAGTWGQRRLILDLG